MSRAIPIFGAHECTGACWELPCPANEPPPRTRKQRRPSRRYAIKQARRARRRQARRDQS